QKYHTVFCIFTSTKIIPLFDKVREASYTKNKHYSLFLIDSLTTSFGLGLMVQKAAEEASKGKSPIEIERIIHSMIPLTYSVLCTPGLSYLYYSGFVDKAQSLITEMLELYPIFTVEDGHLTPLEKMKTQRHTMGYFQEFIEEFEVLNNISILQSALTPFKEPKINFQNGQKPFIAKHMVNTPLATIFGPHLFGLFLLENDLASF
ncbi:MAG: DegV family protein, partial [Anaerolineaceae bacterium]|nr:DegV family protein [Anaerolineaceae bacterium]